MTPRMTCAQCFRLRHDTTITPRLYVPHRVHYNIGSGYVFGVRNKMLTYFIMYCTHTCCKSVSNAFLLTDNPTHVIVSYSYYSRYYISLSYFFFIYFFNMQVYLPFKFVLTIKKLSLEYNRVRFTRFTLLYVINTFKLLI